MENDHSPAAAVADPLTIAASMGLANLQHEPQRLANEADRLNVELESLVMENYKVFVENLSCSVVLRAEDKKITEISGDMNEKLGSLAQQCAVFKDRVYQFVEMHKRNRKTLQHHLQLVELLEVPQLVDACARNGFHDEALELSSFVNGLERRHLLAAEVRVSVDGRLRGGSSVIQSIVDDVHATLVNLRLQLLVSLSENISLPKQMTILATLRKLDSIFIDRQLALERVEGSILHNTSDKEREQLRKQLQSLAESKLQMDFLEARTVWLRKGSERALLGGGSMGSIQAGSSSEGSGTVTDAEGSATSSLLSSSQNRADLGPYGQAIELLEINRTSWYTIVIQYKSLFPEGVEVSGSGRVGPTISPTSILGTWINKQLHNLLNELCLLLPQIDTTTSLRTVLEQALFFASRMSEVGCDFTMLLLQCFKEQLISRVEKEITVAIGHFKNMIANEKITIEVDDTIREQQIPLYLSQDRALDDGISASLLSASTLSRPSKTADDQNAPHNIMYYPPLAYLLNSVLSALNQLRECPLLIARDDCLQIIAQSLEGVCQHLVFTSDDLRTKCIKYQDQIAADMKSKGAVTTTSVAADDVQGDAAISPEATLTTTSTVFGDVHYANCIAHDLIPHILYCFDCVLPLPNNKKKAGSSSTTKVATSYPQGYRVEKLSERSDVLSIDCHAVLTSCWGVLTKGKLL